MAEFIGVLSLCYFVSQVLQHFPDRYEEDLEELGFRAAPLTEQEEMSRGIAIRQRSRLV